MISAGVDISTVVSVTIERGTKTVSQAGFGTAMILGDNGGFAVNTVREYASITEVAADFAITDEEYLAANALFAQTPSPEVVKIGTRDTPVAQVQTFVLDADLVALNVITVDVDGVTCSTVYAVSHVATMGVLAGLIQAEAGVATAVVGGAGDRTITITAAVAGVPVTLDEEGITLGASQADITITTTVANVGVTEDLNAIVLDDNDWYCLLLTTRTQAHVELAAAWVEANEKIFLTCSEDTDIYDGAVSTDIASVLSAANYTRTAVIFNEDNTDWIDAAWAGRCLPEDPGSITWKFKIVVGPSVSDLTSTRRTAILAKNCNVYTEIGGVDIMEEGTMEDGEFIDVVRGTDWLKARMQEYIYAALVNADKIPYTTQGIAIIEAKIRQALDSAISKGVIAPDPDSYDGQPYWIYVPAIADIATSDRANRLLPDIEWEARLAGAIHRVTIEGLVVV